MPPPEEEAASYHGRLTAAGPRITGSVATTSEEIPMGRPVVTEGIPMGHVVPQAGYPQP